MTEDKNSKRTMSKTVAVSQEMFDNINDLRKQHGLSWNKTFEMIEELLKKEDNHNE